MRSHRRIRRQSSRIHVHTADATRQNSFVASASAVCIGLKVLKSTVVGISSFRHFGHFNRSFYLLTYLLTYLLVYRIQASTCSSRGGYKDDFAKTLQEKRLVWPLFRSTDNGLCRIPGGWKRRVWRRQWRAVTVFNPQRKMEVGRCGKLRNWMCQG